MIVRNIWHPTFSGEEKEGRKKEGKAGVKQKGKKTRGLAIHIADLLTYFLTDTSLNERTNERTSFGVSVKGERNE